ncbi:MAG TPA: hypothetical protein VGC04_06105, partial [Cellulomonas sp.]
MVRAGAAPDRADPGGATREGTTRGEANASMRSTGGAVSAQSKESAATLTCNVNYALRFPPSELQISRVWLRE